MVSGRCVPSTLYSNLIIGQWRKWSQSFRPSVRSTISGVGNWWEREQKRKEEREREKRLLRAKVTKFQFADEM